MPISKRCYMTEEDKYLMSGLARRCPGANLHVVDLPYRLSSWALDDPRNCMLWFEGHELVAWAVLQSPFWTIDYACLPEFEASLHGEILEWSDHRAREVEDGPYARPAWFVMVFADQRSRIDDLEAAGFASQTNVGEDSWSKVLMRRCSVEPAPLYDPPAGFRVRNLAGEDEVEQYVALHQSVFESKNMTVEWRRRVLRHPAYRPELDLIVESPDGVLAAFCICWFDPALRAGHVEPLGCHPEYRHLALGRVALSHGLRRLASAGAHEILVETDSYRNTAYRLYESFGFEVIRDVLVNRKDYATGDG